MKRFQFVIVMALALGACAPKVDNGGYVIDGNLKEQVTEGQTTKDEVLARLGSPSSQSSFGDETWYYITNRKEAVGFFAPEVTKQDIVRIEFDKTGVVSSVKTYNKDDAKNVSMVARATPTEGHELGFFEQLLGNIGRFNHPSNDTVAPGRRPNPNGPI